MSTNKDETAAALYKVLVDSGLSFDDQVKAISMARVAIQPRRSWEEVRAHAKPIEKPKERKKREKSLERENGTD